MSESSILDLQCEAEMQEMEQHYAQAIEEKTEELEELHQKQEDIAPIKDAVYSLCGHLEDSKYFDCWYPMANELFSPIWSTASKIDEGIDSLKIKISNLEEARERARLRIPLKYEQMKQDSDN